LERLKVTRSLVAFLLVGSIIAGFIGQSPIAAITSYSTITSYQYSTLITHSAWTTTSYMYVGTYTTRVYQGRYVSITVGEGSTFTVKNIGSEYISQGSFSAEVPGSTTGDLLVPFGSLSPGQSITYHLFYGRQWTWPKTAWVIIGGRERSDLLYLGSTYTETKTLTGWSDFIRTFTYTQPYTTIRTQTLRETLTQIIQEPFAFSTMSLILLGNAVMLILLGIAVILIAMLRRKGRPAVAPSRVGSVT